MTTLLLLYIFIQLLMVQTVQFPLLTDVCVSLCCTFRFKMFSLADASGRRTALVALRNSIYLIPLGFLAYDCE